MKKEEIDIALSDGESILMNGSADLKVKKWHSPFFTGQVYLTNNRFVFKGRRQIRTLIDVTVVGVGKGKHQISIPLHTITAVEKTKFGLRSLGNEIKISFIQEGKDKWVMFKLTKIGHIARAFAAGVGFIGGVVGGGIAEKTIGEMASKAGGNAADVAARGTAAIEGSAHVAGMTRIAANNAYLMGEAVSGEAVKDKSLQDVWIEAIRAAKNKNIGKKMDKSSPSGQEQVGSISNSEIDSISDNVSRSFEHGKSLYGAQNFKGALECFQNVLNEDPQHKQAWVYKGMALRQLGRDNQDAIDCYREALDIDFDYVRGWIEAGKALRSAGKRKRALTCAEMAIERDADNIAALKLKEEIEKKEDVKPLPRHHCPNCGRATETEWKMCPHCNTDLEVR